VIRTYVSSATNVEERTYALANLSACQGLGFIVYDFEKILIFIHYYIFFSLFYLNRGPVLQAALVPLNYPGVIDSQWFHLNVYSSPAFFSIIIYGTLVLLLIVKFNEYVVLDYDIHIETDLLNDHHDQGYFRMIHWEIFFYFIAFIKKIEKLRSESLRNLPPPDYVAVALALILFFINCFVFSFFET